MWSWCLYSDPLCFCTEVLLDLGLRGRNVGAIDSDACLRSAQVGSSKMSTFVCMIFLKAFKNMRINIKYNMLNPRRADSMCTLQQPKGAIYNKRRFGSSPKALERLKSNVFLRR